MTFPQPKTDLKTRPWRPRGLFRALALAALVGAFGLGASTVGRGATGYGPAADGYSMFSTTANTGATTWWNAGYSGRGVDVALIDTGVSPVPGLDGAGKIVNGPDLSLESQSKS